MKFNGHLRFNCPSVNVNLERLMGTNVIQMTDPSFMLKLRDRVWNAYDTKLENRIKERQVRIILIDRMVICKRFSHIKRIENEREVRLVIKGLYTSYNRPQKFKTFHSRALVSVKPTFLLFRLTVCTSNAGSRFRMSR